MTPSEIRRLLDEQDESRRRGFMVRPEFWFATVCCIAVWAAIYWSFHG